MLLISTLPATIKTGTTFKLTLVNPLYEDHADYTLDVTLPLQGCPSNQAIFGPLHHPAQPLQTLIGRELPMHLIIPPHIDMQGTARITTINEKEVKVQLTSTPLTTTFGYKTDGTPYYIDKLPLGSMYDDAPFIKSVPHAAAEPTTQEIAQYISDNYEATGDHTYTWGLYPTTHFLFHFLDDTQGNVINRHERCLDNTIRFANPTPIAAQPYLLEVLDRILRAIGVKTINIPIRDDWRANIYITNTALNTHIADILPHWTVEEFLTEVCHLFNLTYTLTPDHTTITFHPHPTHITDPTQYHHIRRPLDTHTTEISRSTDTTLDPTTANTDYDTTSIPDPIHLPDEVYQNATILTFPNYTALRGYALSLGRDSWRNHQNLLFVDLYTTNLYTFLRDASIPQDTARGAYQLTQVNQFGPLIQSTTTPYPPTSGRDITIKLRIIPARMQWEKFRITYPYTYHLIGSSHGGTTRQNTVDQDYPHLLSSNTYGEILPYSIDRAINTTDTTDTSSDTIQAPDTIEVALNTAATYRLAPVPTLAAGNIHPTLGDGIPTDLKEGLPIPTPLGINYLQSPTTNYYLPITLQSPTPGSLPTLHPFSLLATDQPTLRSPIQQSPATIDTRAEHTISYLDTDLPLDPTAIYIIHSRRYACRKIEVTLTPTTIQPIRTGYFYEIN